MKSFKLTIDLFAILDFLIVLFLILDTHSIYNALISTNYKILEIAILLLIVRLLLSLPNLLSRVKFRTIIISIIWITYILIYFFVNSSDSQALIKRFIVLPILLIYYFDYCIQFDKLKVVLNHYIKIITIIAVISLFFWLFGSILDIIPSTGWVQIQWGNVRMVDSYLGLYFEWQDDAAFLGRVFFRNIGIFTEAPMFSLHLSVAYLLDYFILQNRSKRKLILYTVTILSSYAVTGILLILMSQVLDYIFSSFTKLLRTRRLNIGLLLIPIVSILAIIYGYRIFDSKLESASGGSRLEDYRIGYQAWRYSPYFGTGFNKYDIINSLKSVRRFARSATGYTNSPMIILTEGGIYFFLGFLRAFIHYFLKSFVLKNKNIFIFSSMMLYLFLTTTFQHTALLIIFISFALVDSTKKLDLA